MGNALKVFALGVCVVALTGCGASKQKVTTCTLEKKDVINEYQLLSTYEITSTGSTVDKVKTTEIISSDVVELLEQFESNLNSVYKKMNEAYGGYNYSITNKDGKVTAVTNIDYSKVDIEQLAKDDSSIKGIINSDNKVLVEKIESLYTSMGATCK